MAFTRTVITHSLTHTHTHTLSLSWQVLLSLTVHGLQGCVSGLNVAASIVGAHRMPIAIVNPPDRGTPLLSSSPGDSPIHLLPVAEVRPVRSKPKNVSSALVGVFVVLALLALWRRFR